MYLRLEKYSAFTETGTCFTTTLLLETRAPHVYIHIQMVGKSHHSVLVYGGETGNTYTTWHASSHAHLHKFTKGPRPHDVKHMHTLTQTGALYVPSGQTLLYSTVQ